MKFSFSPILKKFFAYLPATIRLLIPFLSKGSLCVTINCFHKVSIAQKSAYFTIDTYGNIIKTEIVKVNSDSNFESLFLEEPIMNKNTFTNTVLAKGEMQVYDFGKVKLHAYKTNDPIENEVFLVEKDGNVVILESPCFFDNIQELTDYLTYHNLKPAGILLAYHMAGASFLPGVPVYSTQNADEYGHTGGGAGLIRQFSNIFGNAFDPSIFSVSNYIKEGKIQIGGIEFVITKTAEAFDIEIPEINVLYTHMLGHDCHSIVAGSNHADNMIALLSAYINTGYELILTSHYTPEDLHDVKTKIAYLDRLKTIASRCNTASEFKTAVHKEYPDYSGDNYLDMTAGFFFS